ncbi:MAG: cytochrome b/b6 domain-containing protein [Pseudobdellovibrio sp.]
MKTTRAYDVPTRLFHIFFALIFLGAFFIAKVFDDESAIYPYHMMLGLTLSLVVLLRIVWGLFGSRYARFASYPLKPSQLIKYLKDTFTSKTERVLGHNPASAWSALTMMALALSLGVTGFLMSQHINKEAIEDIHELLAYAFVIVAIAHVAGVILHTLKHHDGIGFSMIHGKKETVPGAVGIDKTYPIVGLVFLALIGTFVFHLNKNYDPSTKQLKLFGSTLQLGGDEKNESKGEADKEGDEEGSEEHNEKE